jgi:hypothetical protein
MAQVSDFITPMNSSDLTPRQNEALKQIQSLPSTSETQIVRINPAALRDRARVDIPLPNRAMVAVEATTRSTTSDGVFSISGPTIEIQKGGLPSGVTTIVVNGDAVTGSIQTDTGLFRIRPLGGGAHALIKVGKFPPEHPPSFNEKLKEQRDLPPFERKSEQDTSTTEIRILVAYTPRVESKVTDVKGLVDLAFVETNQSYRDSGVQIVATSATSAPVKVNYTEAGSHDADLAALQNKTDGKIDEIHQVRDESRADVVVLLIDDGSFCGLASQILATKDTAFVVVYHDCATGYYSFAHEIGHLQGARHNPEADGTNVPFSYGHGFMDIVRKRRTIMSYDCPGGCPRMPQWARPTEWGTPNVSHDARVLNETSKHIGGFR